MVLKVVPPLLLTFVIRMIVGQTVVIWIKTLPLVVTSNIYENLLLKYVVRTLTTDPLGAVVELK